MDVTTLFSRVPATYAGADPSLAGSGAPAGAGHGFGQALTDAISTLDRLQQEADSQTMALAAGEPVELHDVMLAQDRASLSLQLALQVRNKLVEAYQDVMRMQL